MNLPPVRPGEEWLVKSPDVYVKSRRFTACLTSGRIVLDDPDDARVPGRELPLTTVDGIETGENGNGEPVLRIVARSAEGETRRLIMTFARQPGFNRVGERDTRAQWLARYRNIRPGPGRPAPSPVPETRPAPADVARYRKGGYLPREGIDIPEKTPDAAGGFRTVPSLIGIRDNPQDSLAERQPGQDAAQKKIIDAIIRRTASPLATELPPAAIPVRRPNLYANGPSFFCLACGNRVPAGASFCNRCGASLIQPGTGVVRSPWDPPQPGEDPATLAARWGVPVAPAAGSVQQQPVPAGNPNVPSTPPASPEPAPGMRPAQEIPGPTGRYTGFIARRGAVLAVLVIVAGLFVAMMGGSVFTAWNAGTSTMNQVQPGESPAETETGTLSSAAGSPVQTDSIIQSSGTTSAVPAAASSDAVPSSGTYVRVAGSGTWEGTYGAIPAIWAVQGSGEKVYAVESTADTPVSAIFQTTGTAGRDLTVEIYRDGTIISSGTAGSNGTVSL